MVGFENFFIKQFAIQLIKSKKNHNVFSRVREALPTEMYGQFIDHLKDCPIDKTHIIGKYGKKKIEDIDCLFDLSPLSIDSEFKWAKAILSRNIETINDFLICKERYINEISNNNLQRAVDELSFIEKEFGQSLWLIKNKTALLQLKDGLESQKKYVQEVKDASSYRGLIAFISHWVSVRNEGTVTSSRFISEFETILARMAPNLAEGYEPYLRYHILAQEDFKLEDAIHIMRLDFSRSLIDFYEAFIAISRITVFSKDEVWQRQLIYILKKFGNNYNDGRLILIGKLLGVDSSKSNVDENIVVAYDEFLKGNFELSREVSDKTINSKSNDPVSISIASLVNSVSCSNEELHKEVKVERPIGETLKEYLISRASQLINYGPAGAIQAYNDLMKFSMNFPSLPYAGILTIIRALTNLEDDDSNKQAAIFSLHLNNFYPFFIKYYRNNDLLKRYIDNSVNGVETNLSTNYILTQVGEGVLKYNELSDEGLSLLKGTLAWNNKSFTDSLNEGFKLLNSDINYYKRLGQRIVTFSLLELDRVEELCSFASNIYVENNESYTELPLKKLNELFRSNSIYWRKVSHLLSLPILLDAYFKFVDKDDESRLTYSMEDFLESHGVRRPSELKMLIDKFNLDELIYFLKNICIESVMDTYTEFNGISDVAHERQLICDLLSEIDPIHKEDYQEEKRALIRREVIRRNVIEVEQSKIHVDIPKLKDWTYQELNERFLRYLAYLKHGLNSENKAIKEEALAKSAAFDYEGLYSMEVPEDEVNAIFRYMVNEIRDAFASNPDFGLDRFVSTRIRHGILESRLRRPLETNQLVTKKEKQSGPYKLNTYWREVLNLDETQSKRLDQIFSKFSASFDDLINKINSEWLQVKKRNEEKGKFNFLIAEGEVQLLANEINNETTFKEFVDLVLKVLNSKLTFSLTEIRELISEKAKKGALELLNKLQNNVSIFSYSSNYNELDAAINLARTELQTVFDQVVEWFKPSQSVGSTSYDVMVALSVAEAIVKESTPSFKANIYFKEEGITLDILGGLPTFVDVFTNIFENTVKRSGLENPEAEVLIDIVTQEEALSWINIMVTNSLGSNIDVLALEEDLLNRKRLLEKDHYKKVISRDSGGTGLFKINRSLKDFRIIDFNLNSKLDFGIKESKFYITISLPVFRKSDLVSNIEENTEKQ